MQQICPYENLLRYEFFQPLFTCTLQHFTDHLRLPNDDGFGFEIHYGMKRKVPARGYPAVGSSPVLKEVVQEVTPPASPSASPAASPMDQDRPLVGFELHYGMKRKTPARCYPPTDEKKHPEHTLLPALPIFKAQTVEVEIKERPLVGFELHYGMKRKFPARCYPPAKQTPRPESASPPSSADAEMVDAQEKEPELVGFAAHYGCPRRTPPRCYPPAGTPPNKTREVERPLVGFELHYGMKRKTPARCYPPAEKKLHPESALLPAFPASTGAPEGKPVVLTLTFTPPPSFSTTELVEHLTKVHIPSASALYAENGVTNWTVTATSPELQSLLAGWDDCAVEEDEDDEWVSLDDEGLEEEERRKARKEEEKKGEVVLTVWVKSEEGVKGLVEEGYGGMVRDLGWGTRVGVGRGE